jgi:hypothetical protein
MFSLYYIIHHDIFYIQSHFSQNVFYSFTNMSMPFPGKDAIIKTYRHLIRNSNPTVNGKRSRINTLDSPFVDTVRSEYRKHASIDNPKDAWKAHSIGTDAASLLAGNSTYIAALFAGGWCLNRTEKQNIEKVAKFVGFEMPKTYDGDQSIMETLSSGMAPKDYPSIGDMFDSTSITNDTNSVKDESR